MFYLLHGEDDYSRSSELAGMKAKLGDPSMVDLNTIVLDGQTAALDELMEACDTVPFLAERRLVIVKDLATRFERKSAPASEASEAEKTFLQRLRDYLGRLPATARLVFLESRSISKTNPIRKLVRDSEHGHERKFAPPRGAALNRWIADRVRERGGQIEPAAIRLLSAFVGNDTRLLDNEIDKLLTYVNGERPISEEDVRLLVSYVQEADVFEMVDALGRRDSRTAMGILRRLLDNGQAPLYLLHMITRQFRILLRVKQLQARGTSTTDIKGLLGLHPYVVEKMVKQSPNFSIPQLEDIYHRLLEIDVAIKTGEMEPPIALGIFVTEIQ
jgi:DNA polymerase-3 subunit delta